MKKDVKKIASRFAMACVFVSMVIGVIAISLPFIPSSIENVERDKSEKAFLDKKKAPSVSSPSQCENEYVGFVSKELGSLGIKLKLVDNPSEIIKDFRGKMYTKEMSNNLEKDFSTLVGIGGENVDIKKVDSFCLLESHEQFCKSSDLSGDMYYVGELNDTKFFTRGIQSVLLESGSIFYAFITHMNDYQYCKDLEFCLLNGITIDSTITEVFSTLGKPRCVDIYEVENEKPYILCYYANESKSSEISLIFVCDESAKNGYYLSEVTISMMESN